MLQDKIETQKGENKILRQKLQSKSEALVILSQELDKVRNECEDYRELTRRLQTQWSLLSSDLGGPSHVSLFNSSKVSELREENKRLVTEREHLRKVLADREDDIKLIRKQWLKEKKNEEKNRTENGSNEENNILNSEIVLRLEGLQMKYDCLKRDLQSLLDEKVDLIQERDAYKCKVHRLNHSMSALLKSDGYKSLDVDSLLSENRFLKESLEHAKEEKELANEMGRRYKKALEKNNPSSSTGSTAGNADQVKDADLQEIRQLIQQTSFPCPTSLDLNSPSSLRELSTSLLETLNERMQQLKHQRRANKHLMERIAQVEKKIIADEKDDPDAAERILWPSQYLMKTYSPLTMDQENSSNGVGSGIYLTQDLLNEVSSPDISDLQKRFDIIAARASTSSDLSCLDNQEDEEADSSCEVELPDHLQKLVDTALAQLN